MFANRQNVNRGPSPIPPSYQRDLHPRLNSKLQKEIQARIQLPVKPPPLPERINCQSKYKQHAKKQSLISKPRYAPEPNIPRRGSTERHTSKALPPLPTSQQPTSQEVSNSCEKKPKQYRLVSTSPLAELLNIESNNFYPQQDLPEGPRNLGVQPFQNNNRRLNRPPVEIPVDASHDKTGFTAQRYLNIEEDSKIHTHRPGYNVLNQEYRPDPPSAQKPNFRIQESRTNSMEQRPIVETPWNSRQTQFSLPDSSSSSEYVYEEIDNDYDDMVDVDSLPSKFPAKLKDTKEQIIKIKKFTLDGVRKILHTLSPTKESASCNSTCDCRMEEYTQVKGCIPQSEATVLNNYSWYKGKMKRSEAENILRKKQEVHLSCEILIIIRIHCTYIIKAMFGLLE
ncbi:uncharacterized protein LOC130645026 isoform X2 [Hydractinia symbiolongicarpus]|uniref:uncharacterized protein LOC130645026 isoform X2 n=1 Tax=Hydractinia symbiolongicarpus TaxID=13093 RepID=UPI00254A43C6|nr:uncharacterized protein LOC130645026 isoform X2 [Hydractinia symbiolongicarpus]